MTTEKKAAIQQIVERTIYEFSENFKKRMIKQAGNPKGIINRKKNNGFIASLGQDFMIYSALVRSFDSSMGNCLEKMGREIAGLFYEVRGDICSFLLPAQEQTISDTISAYDKKIKPEVKHYTGQNHIMLKDVTSFLLDHKTDNYFYDAETQTHYIIELKMGGDLDNKKAKAEKTELLKEYFLLRNKLGQDAKIMLYFATAYNKNGEDQKWVQERVGQYFAEEELLIGKAYWNFICRDEHGYEVVMEQYEKSAAHLKEAMEAIRSVYFE